MGFLEFFEKERSGWKKWVVLILSLVFSFGIMAITICILLYFDYIIYRCKFWFNENVFQWFDLSQYFQL